MSRRVGAVGRELFLLLGVAGHLLEEGEGAHAVVIVLGVAGGEVAGVFAHPYHELVDFGSAVGRDVDAEGLGECTGHAVAAYAGVLKGLFASLGLALGLAPVVAGLVI